MRLTDYCEASRLKRLLLKNSLLSFGDLETDVTYRHHPAVCCLFTHYYD